MKILSFIILAASMCGSISFAQSGDERSVKLDAGAGGGVSFPMAELGEEASRGYSLGLRTRLHGFSPAQFSVGLQYNSLPIARSGLFETHETLGHWILDGALELAVPVGARQYPYLIAGALFAAVDRSGSLSLTSSGGLEVGAGIVESFAPRSTIDFSLTYQMMNLFRKDPLEGDLNQIRLTGYLMFDVLR